MGQYGTIGASKKPHVVQLAGCGFPSAPHDGMSPRSHFRHVKVINSAGLERFCGVGVHVDGLTVGVTRSELAVEVRGGGDSTVTMAPT